MWYLAICSFLLLSVLPASAWADYDPPTFEDVVRKATAIVDATVEGFTEEGYARLTIHEHLKGKDAPTTIKRVWLTCIANRALASDELVPAMEVLEKAERKLLAISRHSTDRKPQHIAEIGDESYGRYARLHAAEDKTALSFRLNNRLLLPDVVPGEKVRNGLVASCSGRLVSAN